MSLFTPAGSQFKLHPLQKEFSKIRKAYVVLLIVPPGILIILFKLIKYSILTSSPIGFRSYENYLGQLMVNHAPMPILIGAIAAVCSALIVLRLPKLGVLFLPLVLSFIAAIGYSLRFILENVPLWISWEFFELIRTDLILLLILAGSALLLLRITRSKFMQATLFTLHTVIVAIGCLAAFEFGYFVQTGSLADSYLLQYSLDNFASMRSVIASEMSAGQYILLAIPAIMTLLPVMYRMYSRSRAKVVRYDVHKKGISLTAPLLIGAALVIYWLPAIPVNPTLEPVRENLFVDIVTRMLEEDEPLHVDDAERLSAVLGIPSEPVSLKKDSTALASNLVIIVLESTRADATTLFDEVLDTTPFLDSLRSRALVVEDMSAIVPHTNKALVPILCGIYPKISQDESQVAAGTKCLPSLLSDSGYASAFFTPATLDFENKGRLLNQMGFDDSFGHGDFPVEGFSRVNYFGYEDRIILEPVIEWAREKRDQGSPFLLGLLTVTTHHDYTVPDSFERRDFGVDNEEYNRYLNLLRYQDGMLADLFDQFEREGLADSTAFIIVGDHGEAFGEHGEYYHNTIMWQEGVHVPAVVVLPSDTSGTISGPRQQQDIFNTAARILGYSVEGGPLPGVDLFARVPEDRELFTASWTENQAMAIRKANRKYIFRFHRRPSQLFDLRADPLEQNSLLDTLPADSASALDLRLMRWRHLVNAAYESAGPSD